MPDGSRMITYTWVSAQARPESFIPLVGAFVGGADSESSILQLKFDSDETLKYYTVSNSKIGAGSGFEAYSQDRSAQPRISK